MKQFIKCPECGIVQLARTDGGIFFQCNNCKKIQHVFPDPLPALSIRQPWAWLIVNGYKDIENRDTLKNFRGDFLIHAGGVYDRKWREKIHLGMVKLIDAVIDSKFQNFRYGGIIGHATISGCVEKSDSPWFVGKYGLLIKNPKPLPFTPCKGKLSFFKPEIL